MGLPAYVSLESLRNSIATVQLYVAAWVALRLRLVPAQDELLQDARRWLWSALGLEPETVDIITERLGPARGALVGT